MNNVWNMNFFSIVPLSFNTLIPASFPFGKSTPETYLKTLQLSMKSFQMKAII